MKQKSNGETECFRGVNIPVLSLNNEQSALSLFKKICEEAFSQYPETYEYDMERLKRNDLTYNERNCLMFRASEKKVGFS